MGALIGYDNLLETGTVTATTEQASYPKENAFDWLPFDSWKASAAGTVYLMVDAGAAAVVDYWAIAFHDLYNNAGTIKLQYSSDNVNWSDADTVQTPANGSPIMRPITQRNVQYYRFEISSTGSPSAIGMLSLGQALQLEQPMQVPFMTPKHGRDKTILNNVSEGGQFLGRSILRNGQAFSIEQKDVSPTWIDANWEALADHIEQKPFFFLWDSVNHAADAIFAWAEKGIKYPNYSSAYFQDLSIPCRGNV